MIGQPNAIIARRRAAFRRRSGAVARQLVLPVTASSSRSSCVVRASAWSIAATAWVRASAASASARRARCSQPPAGAGATPGMRPSHFSATRMCAAIQVSGWLTSSSEWWWTTLKSAVTTLRPASRTCRQKSKS